MSFMNDRSIMSLFLVDIVILIKVNMDEEGVQQMEDTITDDENSTLDTDGDNTDGDPTASRDTLSDRLTPTQKEQIIQFVHDLKNREKRAKALHELSKNREHFSDLAPMIWHSIGTIAAL